MPDFQKGKGEKKEMQETAWLNAIQKPWQQIKESFCKHFFQAQHHSTQTIAQLREINDREKYVYIYMYRNWIRLS